MMSETASDVVARQMRELRKGQGLKASDLAERCADLGMPHLTAATISNIETGRRDRDGRRRRAVTVDELLALAAALNTAPVDLLVPPDDRTTYRIAPQHETSARTARYFVQGFRPLPGADVNAFLSHRPQREVYEYAVGPDEQGRQQFHFTIGTHPDDWPEHMRDQYRGPRSLPSERRRETAEEGDDDARR